MRHIRIHEKRKWNKVNLSFSRDKSMDARAAAPSRVTRQAEHQDQDQDQDQVFLEQDPAW